MLRRISNSKRQPVSPYSQRERNFAEKPTRQRSRPDCSAGVMAHRSGRARGPAAEGPARPPPVPEPPTLCPTPARTGRDRFWRVPARSGGLYFPSRSLGRGPSTEEPSRETPAGTREGGRKAQNLRKAQFQRKETSLAEN